MTTSASRHPPYAQDTWGIPVDRRNRAAVVALLRLARPTRSRNRAWRRVRRLLHAQACLVLGSDFRSGRFGEQLYLPHPYGIVVHAGVVLGDRCTIYQHVTLGEDNRRPGVPVLGDDVVVGAGAAILGPVTVGDGASVGANAVVVSDVAAGAVVVGVPARPTGSSR